MTTTSQARAQPTRIHPTPPRCKGALVGGVLLLGAGAVHLDLYLTGYGAVPTIGWLFLVQVVTALGLGCSMLALGGLALGGGGRRSVRPLGMTAAAATLFSLSTLAGYLVSLEWGLFGFHEVRTGPGVVAGSIELAASLVCGYVAASGSAVRARASRRVLAPLLTATGVVLLVLAEAGAGTAAVSPRSPNARSSPTTGGEVTVVIKNFDYHPGDPKAKPGEKIVVKNEDSVDHTFTAAPGTAKDDAFSTGDIPPGKSRVVVAPSKPGTYKFLCLIHQFMTGTLTVSAST